MVTSPVSSGVRSASSARPLNSGASSRKSTPRWASEMAPGRATLAPPPTSAAMDALWCGWEYGGRRINPPDSSAPTNECSADTSSACSSGKSGSSPGNRSASIDLPTPGAPCRKTWCPPAAATSTAQQASACPRTSARSGRGPAGEAGPTATSKSGWPSTGRPCSTSIKSSRQATPQMVMPLTSWASLICGAGTIAVPMPASRAASSAGRTPRTCRTRPSRPTSPTSTLADAMLRGTVPAAASTAATMARS